MAYVGGFFVEGEGVAAVRTSTGVASTVGLLEVGITTKVLESAYQVDFAGEDFGSGGDAGEDLGGGGIEEEDFHAVAAIVARDKAVNAVADGAYDVQLN